MIAIFLLFCYANAVTYIDSYFKQPFEIQYSTPGSYVLYPKYYKYAPTIFVSIYGAGGGSDGVCTGQNGAYLSVLFDTRSGTTSFNIITGKGGIGDQQNITRCNMSIPVIEYINRANGGDSSIISLDKKIWAVAKGGLRSPWPGGLYGAEKCGQIIPNSTEEKGGYTNISFGYRIKLLERLNGENSYAGNPNYAGTLDPGYGGWRSSKFDIVNLTPCAINRQLYKAGSGNDGLVRVFPVAIPINMLGSIDIESVDIDFFMHS
jgi:hypothetical protein